MKKAKSSVAAFIIASAVIWGVVIISCSLVLRETECYSKIQNILGGGVAAHLIIIWGPLAVMFKKAKETTPDADSDS